LSHVIAGSAESAFAVLTGHASVGNYFLRFLAPTLFGNTLGGAALVALLNHAPLVPELTGEMGNEPPRKHQKTTK
jgi:formate-nitrite transporter family protein